MEGNAMANSHYERHAIRAIVGKLKGEAVSRYGDVRGMFRAIDKDGGGELDVEEFKAAMERTGLHTIVSEAEQDLVFEKLDVDGSGSIGYMEFAQLFNPDLVTAPKQDGGGEGLHADSVTPRTAYQLERLKEKIVEKIMAKCKEQKVSYKSNSKMILNTFQQLDEDGDEALTYADVEKAFTGGQLDLGFSNKEIQQVLLASDKNRDGLISYKEFIDFLKVHDIEPNYSPFYDGRRRVVDKLKQNSKTPLKWQGLYDSRVREQSLIRTALRDETLRKEMSMTAGQVEYPPHNMLSSTNIRPRLAASGDLQRTNMALLRQKGPRGSIPREKPEKRSSCYDKVSNGTELIAKLRQKQKEEMTAPGRYSGTTMHKDDWQPGGYDRTRVGLGTGGMSENSGQYMNAEDRFRTTQHTFFGSRPDQLGDSTPDMAASLKKASFQRNKTAIKTATMNGHMQRILADAKYQVRHLLLSFIVSAAIVHCLLHDSHTTSLALYALQECVHEMQDEARLQTRCKTRHGYFNKVRRDCLQFLMRA
jgi:Ca2+-binding EF-hand superfamily protein